MPERKKTTLIVFGIAIIAVFYAAYFYLQQSRIKDNEVKAVTDKIGRLMYLPEESPTLATVTDKNKLSNQPFFKKAENGDKLLIYAKSGKAIMYRPSQNKIVDIAFLNLTVTPTPLPEPQKVLDAKVVIYNGTKKPGLTSLAERKLKSPLPNLEILDKDNASGSAYPTTLVVVTDQRQKK